jgi:tetratricopeptide (TPR) repeat protein
MRLLTLCLALSWSLVAFAQDAAPPAAAAPTADAASFATKLDELWKTRDAADAGKLHEEVIKDGLKAFPNDYEILWRAARYRWWVADGVTEEKLKKQVAKEGWNFAKRAVEAKQAGSEGHYFTALNIGAYSQAVGVLKALGEGLEGQFVDNLEFSLKANESFDRYGGRTAKGRYHWELPWPKRDLGKSKTELQKSIDKNPEHLRNYYFLADTLLADGDAKAAKTAIDKVLTGSDAYDPPEARRVKAWAKTLAAKIDEKLK